MEGDTSAAAVDVFLSFFLSFFSRSSRSKVLFVWWKKKEGDRPLSLEATTKGVLGWYWHAASRWLLKMIIPVRCFTCGKLIGHLWEKWLGLLKAEYTEAEALDALQLRRYCCRRMLITHVELIEKLLQYKYNVG
jgi:DNA-directed RNA polymerase I, II, and III subunit RPABC5